MVPVTLTIIFTELRSASHESDLRRYQHFVAVFNPSDQWHASALEVETQLQQVKRVTTELVLVEVLNYFAAYRHDVKKNIARAIRRWLESASVETVLHTMTLSSMASRSTRRGSTKGTA